MRREKTRVVAKGMSETVGWKDGKKWTVRDGAHVGVHCDFEMCWVFEFLKE